MNIKSLKSISFKTAACTLTIMTGILLSTSTTFATTLIKAGSTGNEVSKLQQTLKDKGYFNHSVTGYFGTITKDSVIRFQGANGLATDGIVGPQTISKLYENNSTLLKIGMSGAQVSQLQQSLKDKGYFNHNVTGYFGNITKNAVIAFQQDNGLAVDGIAGPKTMSKLNNNNSTVALNSSNLSEDIHWLARIIEAEAAAEPYSGKVAVGSVVMNRVKSSLFPNNVKGVIFEYYQGIPMFSPVANGTIYNIPSQDSINAAYVAYNGEKPVGNATYFFNPSKSSGSWIVKNKSYITQIGGHAFYG
jgi:N-acetylmuramoyl-L-alanine amidase